MGALLIREGGRMRDALDEQIAAYEDLRASIKEEHGSVWALIADSQLVRTFTEFAAAARFAHDNYRNKQILIRHTDERKMETAPFIHVHAEE